MPISLNKQNRPSHPSSNRRTDHSFFSERAVYPKWEKQTALNAETDVATIMRSSSDGVTHENACNCPQCTQNSILQRKEEKHLDQSEIEHHNLSSMNDFGIGVIAPKFEEKLNNSKGGGSHLPEDTKAEMEKGIGADFSNVRLHKDQQSAEMNNAIQSKAFTHGQDIFFNKDQYAPKTSKGRHLLAHELTHVVQQSNSQTVRPFFGKIWKGIKKGAKWLGSEISQGAKAVGKGLKWLGGKIWGGVKWFGKQLWSKVSGIFFRVKRWITNLPASIGRLITGLISGLKSFKPWTAEWWESLGKANTWLNFLKWTGARLIDMLEIAGVGEAYETIKDFIKFNSRPLNAEEKSAALSVFGSSIEYNLIRVDEAAVIGPAFSGRAYTSFHTINSWGREPVDVMIHELTHVWQYEHAGAIYMPQAIHAQVWGEGYVYKGAAGLRKAQTEGKGFSSFNREQQAQIVQDFYLLKTQNRTDSSDNPATSSDLPLYADFVVEVSTLSKSQLLGTTASSPTPAGPVAK